jgi:hypothetical protein
MKIVQALIYYLVFLAILAGGVLISQFELHELYEFAIATIPDEGYVRWAAVAVMAGVGVSGLVLPWARPKRASRKIEFQSQHGYIVIELDSVQHSLQKAMSKLPEIKSISLQVLPSDNDRRVRIVADVVVIKPPGIGIRETAAQLENKLSASAKRMLGVDDIASLDLNIIKTLMNPKKEFDTTIDDNRLLEHQNTPAPEPQAAAPAPAAVSPEPAPTANPPQSEAGLGAPLSDPGSSNGETGETSGSESESSKGLSR